MSTRTARRLIPLAAAVLAAHLVLLGWEPPQPLLHPPAPGTQAFRVRQVAPPAPAETAPPRAARPARAQAAAAPVAQSTPAPPAPEPFAETTAPQPAQPASAAAAPLVPAPVQADSGAAPVPAMLVLPDPVRVHYDVTLNAKGLTVPARAQLDWRHDGSRYEARLEVSGTLLPRRVQESTGAITPEGLAPGRFSQQGRTEEATHFERERGVVVFSNNRPQAPLLAGVQDRLSIVVQLSMLVAADPQRYAPGAAIAIPTAGTRDSETWIFSVLGEEDLHLPGGALRALKLQRNPRKEYDQQVELWLAPRMDYAPVRLRLTHPNGDSSDLRWSSTDKG